jgi:hypothetical protein
MWSEDIYVQLRLKFITLEGRGMFKELLHIDFRGVINAAIRDDKRGECLTPYRLKSSVLRLLQET